VNTIKYEYPFKTTPRKHQYDSWMRSRKQRYHAHLMEMGTGKTKITIDECAYMYDNGWIDSVLVFGNKGSYTNWIEEIETHLSSHINKVVVTWSSSMSNKETERLEKIISYQGNCLKILLMNIEALAYERSFKVAYQFAKNHNTLGIVDESTTIKNPIAKRTKAAWKISDVCKARRILTGSLIDNRPLDAWAQFEFLKKGLLGYNSFFAYKCRYAELIKVRVPDNRTNKTGFSSDGKREVHIVKGYRNLEYLRQSISNYATIIKKDECLDLPPKIYQKYYIDLTDEQRRMYEQMKNKALIELESTIVSTKIVLTKLLRLHQITCGFLKDDDGNMHEIKSNRINALHEILDESQEKGIIWANYRYSIQGIENLLKKEYGQESVKTYYGDTTKDERQVVKQEAKRGVETDMRWLVSNQASGGYGNTWTAFNLVVYYANCFDGELRNQSEDRCHRIGQTRSVTYVDIIAKDTIDEKILKTLKDKKSISDMITPSNWREWF